MARVTENKAPGRSVRNDHAFTIPLSKQHGSGFTESALAGLSALLVHPLPPLGSRPYRFIIIPYRLLPSSTVFFPRAP